MYCAAMKRNLAANTPRCKSAVLRSSMFLIYMELRVGRGSLHTTGTVTKTAGGDSSTCLKGHGLTVHSPFAIPHRLEKEAMAPTFGRLRGLVGNQTMNKEMH